jgi:hypothetical protein
LRSKSLPLTAALLLALGGPGCSDRVSTTLLAPAQAGRYALTGRVQITGTLAGLLGPYQPTGTRVVDDATGVRVRITRPDGSTDSVLTVDGAFEFRADAPGLYRASCWVVAPDTVATSDVTLADVDVAFPDTLKLAGSEELDTYPNPFSAVDGLAIEFETQAAQQAELTVLNVSGTPVYTESVNSVAGFMHHHWHGVEQGGGELPDGLYWLVVRFDGAPRYDPVFKE